MRVDVFSAKGGVGKTTVAYRLARKWSETSEQPVLIVDADLSGTCLGDLVEPTTKEGWHTVQNLIHLVCGRPEELPSLVKPNELPVYELRPVPDDTPKRVSASVSGAQVVFCPSHTETYLSVPGIHGETSPVDLAVLQALLGHESAGGWVGHVIESVIAATHKLIPGGLAGVVVDHGPGIGGLQWSQMVAIDIELQRAIKENELPLRRALFVTSRDMVDLAAARTIDDRLKRNRQRKMGLLSANCTWVVNRLPSEWGPPSERGAEEWRTSLEASLKLWGMGPSERDKWFRHALPLFEEKLLANAYATSELAKYYRENDDVGIAAIHERVTVKAKPKAAL